MKVIHYMYGHFDILFGTFSHVFIGAVPPLKTS